jgi:hypothetical protein
MSLGRPLFYDSAAMPLLLPLLLRLLLATLCLEFTQMQLLQADRGVLWVQCRMARPR